MAEIKSVCVYCGSSLGIDKAYRKEAESLGGLMARHGIRLVYGGGRTGIMGAIADSVLGNGGEVTGIIPDHLSDKEVAHSGLADLRIVSSMHERKMMMVEESDAFVVLPGGFGTMDEFFEVLTWRYLGLHEKPIFIINTGEYWAPLKGLVDHMVEGGFALESSKAFFNIVETPEALMAFLKDMPDIEEKEPEIEKM